jgi:hypothetical protein
MGKNLKYGEFTFGESKAKPTAAGYARGGMKREPEAVVKREVALLRKAGAPKALIKHEVREIKGEKDTPATKKAEVAMLRKAKAPRAMLEHEMKESVAMRDGGKMSKMDKKVGKVMGEFKEGSLHSGKNGPVVKNPKQAVAIALSEGRKAVKMKEGGQYAAGAVEKMRKEGDVLNELSKKYGTMSQKYENGGSVAKKLEKHANMPASKAHGPGGAAKLQKGGVPVHSRVPKIARMK